jgi:hypothetical protein
MLICGMLPPVLDAAMPESAWHTAGTSRNPRSGIEALFVLGHCQRR